MCFLYKSESKNFNLLKSPEVELGRKDKNIYMEMS
jgi:hypothetical protein